MMQLFFFEIQQNDFKVYKRNNKLKSQEKFTFRKSCYLYIIYLQ